MADQELLMMTIIIVVYVSLTGAYMWTVRHWLTSADGMVAMASMSIAAIPGVHVPSRPMPSEPPPVLTEGDLARQLMAGTLDPARYHAAMAAVAAAGESAPL